MKILMLTRYGRLGASSRLRSYQYIPFLEQDGIEVCVAPLFDNSYVSELQTGRRRFLDIARSYSNRIADLCRLRQFDLVWVEKEALPWIPASVERIFFSGTVPYIIDYDDAVFHYYDEHSSRIVRTILSGKHADLIRAANAIVAGNSYLCAYARNSDARNLVLIPTVIDLEKYKFAKNHSRPDSNSVSVGWIGQTSTAKMLMPYRSLFHKLSSSGLARFVAIGISAGNYGLPMESFPWSEGTEVRAILSFDVGIMPLPDEPFARGKCGYKLIQYMACGLPVIASPVGANCEIVEHGVNGFLADTEEDWRYYLSLLIDDVSLRNKMGCAGRKKVEERYCIQVTAPLLVDLFRNV